MQRIARLLLGRRLSRSNPETVVEGNTKRNSSNLPAMASTQTLAELGYAFNNEGQLRKLDENGQPGPEPFQFNVSDRHQECQVHYEELGAAVTDYVYHLLETEVKLVRLSVPKGKKPGTFIFASPDYDKKTVLMILIHGSGAVRAGQWARSLIINENIDTGTQIPYIKKALTKDYGVLVLNTNDNYLPNGKEISQSGTAEKHAYYVWDTYVHKTKAESIIIVAHSYGGVVTVSLADKFKNEFKSRVKAVALTDSVHTYANIKMTDHLKQVSKNWVSSSAPLDTPENTPEFDITRVSAGHPRHEMTSHSCIESLFEFIEKKLSNV